MIGALWAGLWLHAIWPVGDRVVRVLRWFGWLLPYEDDE